MTATSMWVRDVGRRQAMPACWQRGRRRRGRAGEWGHDVARWLQVGLRGLLTNTLVTKKKTFAGLLLLTLGMAEPRLQPTQRSARRRSNRGRGKEREMVVVEKEERSAARAGIYRSREPRCSGSPFW